MARSYVGTIQTRRQILRSFSLTTLGLGGVALIKPWKVDAATPWHQLSQSTRNLLVIARGRQDLGDNVGVQCKPWVQDVVREASSGATTVPSNTEGGVGCAWVSGSGSSSYIGRTFYRYIKDVKPGEIIQMKITTPEYQEDIGGFWTPHTAIVTAVTSTYMKWLDSNYVAKKTVGEHKMTFNEWFNRVICYNIYWIL